MRSFILFIRCQVIFLVVCMGCARAPVEQTASPSNLPSAAVESSAETAEVSDSGVADETSEATALAESAKSQEAMSEELMSETVSMQDFEEPYSHKMAALELRWAELQAEFKTLREATTALKQ